MKTHIFTFEDYQTGTSFEVAVDMWTERNYYPYQEGWAAKDSLEYGIPYNPQTDKPFDDKNLENRIINYFEKFEIERINYGFN